MNILKIILKFIENILELIFPGPNLEGLMALSGPTKEEHEKTGETLCPNCNKKFESSFVWCTRDIVYIPTKPDRLSTTIAYCPHCHRSFELGYTPITVLDIYKNDNQIP